MERKKVSKRERMKKIEDTGTLKFVILDTAGFNYSTTCLLLL